MSKFRKKPVVVEATQWFENGNHPDDNCPLVHDEHGRPLLGEGTVVRRYRHPLVSGVGMCAQCKAAMDVHGWIDTREGGHIVCPGDWIITGVEGEKYACKPSIFEATYERVEG